MTKTCNECKNEKDISLFSKGKKYKDGRRNYCKECHAFRTKKYYENNPEMQNSPAKIMYEKTKRRNWQRHNMQEENYNKMYLLHEGKCHACKDRPATNIDHSHECCPGSYSCGLCVRGILCNQCNTALGLLGDSRQKVKSLLDYAIF
jgi:hypothetical protein